VNRNNIMLKDMFVRKIRNCYIKLYNEINKTLKEITKKKIALYAYISNNFDFGKENIVRKYVKFLVKKHINISSYEKSIKTVYLRGKKVAVKELKKFKYKENDILYENFRDSKNIKKLFSMLKQKINNLNIFLIENIGIIFSLSITNNSLPTSIITKIKKLFESNDDIFFVESKTEAHKIIDISFYTGILSKYLESGIKKVKLIFYNNCKKCTTNENKLFDIEELLFSNPFHINCPYIIIPIMDEKVKNQ